MKTERQPSEQERADRDRIARRREMVRLSDLSTIGLVFPVAMILGFFAGRYVGGWFDRAALGAMIGGLFGLVAGFYNVWKVNLQLVQRDEEEARLREQAADGSESP